MVWQERIAAAFSMLDQTDSALVPIFYPPATFEDLATLEASLKVVLPSDLSALLAETNGVGELLSMGKHGDKMIGYFIWPIKKIVEDNRRFRNVLAPLYKRGSFDDLLFFADAGNGDQFAYQIQDRQAPTATIYAWDHEDDDRAPVASSLEEFVALAFTDKMT